MHYGFCWLVRDAINLSPHPNVRLHFSLASNLMIRFIMIDVSTLALMKVVFP